MLNICKCITAHLKRETILTASFRLGRLELLACFGVKTYFCEMKMYEIKGKQTYNKLQKHTRIGYISKHFNKFSKFNKNIKEPVLSSSPSLDARERDYRA